MRGPRVTVALSSHRVETLAFAEELVAGHDLVILEEPADELFHAMLDGAIGLDDYVEEIAPAFPVFARASCQLWRRVHRSGVRVVQVDPFLEELGRIHDFFEAGGKPDQIPRASGRRMVYDAERECTGALVAFYAIAARRRFEEIVDSTLRFARLDAARTRLRDRMRADAVLEAAAGGRRVYVEAGYLHHALWLELRRHRGARGEVRAVWLLEPVLRRRSGRRQLLAPGDRLTLAYLFRPDRHPPRARLLAARSLVSVKLETKEEMLPGADPFPHTTDELETAALVEGLSYADCEELYGAIRGMSDADARARVREYRAGLDRAPGRD